MSCQLHGCGRSVRCRTIPVWDVVCCTLEQARRSHIMVDQYLHLLQCECRCQTPSWMHALNRILTHGYGLPPTAWPYWLATCRMVHCFCRVRVLFRAQPVPFIGILGLLRKAARLTVEHAACRSVISAVSACSLYVSRITQTGHNAAAHSVVHRVESGVPGSCSLTVCLLDLHVLRPSGEKGCHSRWYGRHVCITLPHCTVL